MRQRRIPASVVSSDSARSGKILIRRIALLAQKGLGGMRGRPAIHGQKPAIVEDIVLAQPVGVIP